jgi:WD40 repeat protein
VGTWFQPRLYDAATGKPRGAPHTNLGSFARAVAFSPDGTMALTGGDTRQAWLWDTTDGHAIGIPMNHKASVSRFAFGPDGKTFAVVTGSEVRVYDPPRTRPAGRSLAHLEPVTDVAYSPDGQTLLTACQDGRALLWSVATGDALGEPLAHHGPVRAIAFGPDGKSLLTGGDDGSARLWDPVSRRLIGEVLTGKAAIRVVAYGSNGSTLLTATEDGMAQLWDTRTGRRLGRPHALPEKLVSLRLSTSGNRLLALGQEGSLRTWDMSEVPDDLPRVAAWIEAITGLTTDTEGSIRPLDAAGSRQRRELLDRLGGAP